jgi:hypothetical protein
MLDILSNIYIVTYIFSEKENIFLNGSQIFPESGLREGAEPIKIHL